MENKKRWFELRIEKWEKPFQGFIGTIRTVPENYYVCDLKQGKNGNITLLMRNLEVNTRYIDRVRLLHWFGEQALS